jgi:DNA repair exonuclease SbcCD ATPase subunit
MSEAPENRDGSPAPPRSPSGQAKAVSPHGKTLDATQQWFQRIFHDVQQTQKSLSAFEENLGGLIREGQKQRAEVEKGIWADLHKVQMELTRWVKIFKWTGGAAAGLALVACLVVGLRGLSGEPKGKDLPFNHAPLLADIRQELQQWKPPASPELTKQLDGLSGKLDEAARRHDASDQKLTALNKRFDDLKQHTQAIPGLRSGVADLRTTIGEQVQAPLKKVQEAQTRQGTRLDELQGEQGKQGGRLAELQTTQKKQTERLEGLEQILVRLRDAMQLPPDEQLAQVLFVLDGGQRMAEYRHADIRAALLEAVDAAVRQTPRRELGLFSSHGKDLASHLKMERHYAGDVAALRQRSEDMNPVRTEDTNWQAACERSLNLLSTREGRVRRLVYLTCNPQAPTPLASADLAALALKHHVEVWVVQLVKDEKDAPSRELSHLAAETGGQFTTLYSGPEGEGGRKRALARRRLSAVLYQALDLRPAPDSSQP